MTYIPSLHKVQIGLEDSFGSGAVGSIQAPGITNLRLDPKVEAEQLIDKRGTTMPAHESFVKRRWSEGTIDGYLNYQEAYVWLDGMFGEATPVGDVRTYSGSQNWASDTEQSIALYYGQTGALYTVSGVLPTELNISGATGEPLRFSYGFFGLPITDGATFEDLSDDVVEWCMGTQTSIYLDEGADAAPGTTPMTDIAFRFDAIITANRKPVWHMGNQTPDAYNIGKWGGSMNLVFEADATLLGHLGDVLDATTTPKSYAVRVRTTDTENTLDLDFVGTVVTPPVVITDDDGIVTVEMNLVPTYGSHANILSCWGAELTVGS